MKRRNKIRSLKSKMLSLVTILIMFMATGCIQEKLADPMLPQGAPEQYERWTCTVRAPVGTWKYKVGLNSKLYNNQWTTKEWTVSSSSDPLLPVDSVKVDPTYSTPGATGEVVLYGNKTFRFYTSDAKKNLASGEGLLYASLLFEPFNYNIGKDFFTNQMVARFFIYKKTYESEYGPLTNAAVAGGFNQWGKGGERNRNEFKDDGVWPDKKANDDIWTVEVPLDYIYNSTYKDYTFEYKFYLNPQWDAEKGQWQDDSYKAVADLANLKNKNEERTDSSLITISTSPNP